MTVMRAEKSSRGVFPNGSRLLETRLGTCTKGPYSGLPDAWKRFGRMLQSLGAEKFTGPPGDVYVCDTLDHQGPDGEKLITILWAPLKD